jgi:hypothetical protein
MQRPGRRERKRAQWCSSNLNLRPPGVALAERQPTLLQVKRRAHPALPLDRAVIRTDTLCETAILRTRGTVRRGRAEMRLSRSTLSVVHIRMRHDSDSRGCR